MQREREPGEQLQHNFFLISKFVLFSIVTFQTFYKNQITTVMPVKMRQAMALKNHQ